MKHLFKSYIHFLIRSKNQHGIHSPFVYDLVTNCFYDKKKYPEYATLQSFRSTLLKSKKKITITHFGAGSRVFKSDERKISAIAKHAGITFKRQKLLFRLARYFKPASVLELGTSLGMATAALAMGNKNASVITVEGCTATATIAQQQFNRFGLKNSTLINTSFDRFFNDQTTQKFDLVYIDGSHDKKTTLFIFNKLLQHVHNNSILIFDDIYWSPQMTQTWKQISLHPRVTVSIDTFQWGFIFFRKEQKKQHFTIRV